MARFRILPATLDREAAWGAPAHGEPRWPASLAVLAALALYITLDRQFKFVAFGPRFLWPIEQWLTPILEMALLLPLSLGAPRRHHNEPKWAGIATVALIAVVNLSNVVSLGLLVDRLLGGKVLGLDLGRHPGTTLFFAAINIWLTNVIVFALWYWELDRGGPDERSSPQHREPDFLFPQMSTPGCAPQGWRPHFIDYLYLSFTNATAFSPTDTLPLTRWAKLLMLVQSLAALLTIVMVAARAVNILS